MYILDAVECDPVIIILSVVLVAMSFPINSTPAGGGVKAL
jgi:hypothetical protein